MLIGKIRTWNTTTNRGTIEVDADQDRKSDLTVFARHCAFRPRYGLRVCFDVGEYNGETVALRIQLYGRSKETQVAADTAGLAKTLARGVAA